MESDWLFDKPRSYYWLRVAASNLANQSTCLAGVTQSHCNPRWDFPGCFCRLPGLEDSMERVLRQSCDFSWDHQIPSDSWDSDVRFRCAELREET